MDSAAKMCVSVRGRLVVTNMMRQDSTIDIDTFRAVVLVAQYVEL